MVNIIPVGKTCITAHVLNCFGLRKCGYPFDWQISNLSYILDCINNKFLYLKTIDYFTPIQKEHEYYEVHFTGSSHKIYTDVHYAHHNFSEIEHFNGLLRSIERFLDDYLQSVFLYVDIFEINDEKIEDVTKFYEELIQHNSNQKFIAIFPDYSVNENVPIHLYKEINNLQVYVLKAEKYWYYDSTPYKNLYNMYVDPIWSKFLTKRFPESFNNTLNFQQ